MEALLADWPLLRALAGLVLGTIAGSFLATILIRWPEDRSILSGRSRCDSCHGVLDARDLVPVISFIAARSLCRHCGIPIDTRHIAVELAAGAMGMIAFFASDGWAGPVGALLGWWLLLIALIDLQHQWLPDRLTLPLIPAGLAVAWLGIGPALSDRAIGTVAGLATLWLIAFAYRRLRGREGMGGGDPKLFAALGAWLGWMQLPSVLIGAGLLGLASLVLMRLRRQMISADLRLPLGTLMAFPAWAIWLLIA